MRANLMPTSAPGREPGPADTAFHHVADLDQQFWSIDTTLGHLRAWRVQAPRGLIAVAWCGSCGRYHRHHHLSGPRGAHCPPGSPYTSTGYIIAVEGPATAAIQADLERREPRGPAVLGS